MTLLTGKRVLQSKSFILIELILVILLISVITGLSTPLFRNTLANLKLKNTSFNIAKLANYAQEMAIVERASYKLNFNLEEGKYWLSRDDLSDQTTNYKKIEGSYGKYFLLPRGLNFSTFSNEDEQSLSSKGVLFYPDGRCSPSQIKIVNKEGQGRLLRFKGFGSQVEIIDTN